MAVGSGEGGRPALLCISANGPRSACRCAAQPPHRVEYPDRARGPTGISILIELADPNRAGGRRDAGLKEPCPTSLTGRILGFSSSEGSVVRPSGLIKPASAKRPRAGR